MRKYLLLVALFAVVFVIASCKLDKPIFPGDPGYVRSIPPGGDTTGTGTTDTSGGGTGTGGTTVIDSSLLAGTWKVTKTYAGGIIDGQLSLGQASSIDLIGGVSINSTAGSMLLTASVFLGNTNLTYTSQISNGKLYLTLSQDPFQRSSNAPIEVISLTATTMTWLAIDPAITTNAGHTLQVADEEVFTKQ